MYLKNKEILEEILEDEGAILLNKITGTTFIINNVGYCIWKIIDQNTTDSIVDEIYKNMINKDEYIKSEIDNYVSEYIQILIDSGLVVCQS